MTRACAAERTRIGGSTGRQASPTVRITADADRYRFPKSFRPPAHSDFIRASPPFDPVKPFSIHAPPGLDGIMRRLRAAWLETFHPGIVGCRVLLEIPHRRRKRGGPFHVRIELSLPGEDVIVSQRPRRHATDRPGPSKSEELDGCHKDALAALHDAFDVARPVARPPFHPGHELLTVGVADDAADSLGSPGRGDDVRCPAQPLSHAERRSAHA
jgi:hypothetical protein